MRRASSGPPERWSAWTCVSITCVICIFLSEAKETYDSTSSARALKQLAGGFGLLHQYGTSPQRATASSRELVESSPPRFHHLPCARVTQPARATATPGRMRRAGAPRRCRNGRRILSSDAPCVPNRGTGAASNCLWKPSRPCYARLHLVLKRKTRRSWCDGGGLLQQTRTWMAQSEFPRRKR